MYILFSWPCTIYLVELNNQAKASSRLEGLIDASDVEVHSRIAFDKPPSLKVLEPLLIAIYEESKNYRIWPVSGASP